MDEREWNMSVNISIWRQGDDDYPLYTIVTERPANSSDTEPDYNWPVLSFFTIVVLAIAGNVLVCLAVKLERKLQNMFNYFLVSLALSDMMSATLVMPLSIIKAFIGKTSISCSHICLLWNKQWITFHISLAVLPLNDVICSFLLPWCMLHIVNFGTTYYHPGNDKLLPSNNHVNYLCQTHEAQCIKHKCALNWPSQESRTAMHDHTFLLAAIHIASCFILVCLVHTYMSGHRPSILNSKKISKWLTVMIHIKCRHKRKRGKWHLK